MSAVAMEPSAADQFIFGDQLLHSRFSLAIELLARIVIATPRSVSAATLADSLGQPIRVVRGLLASLAKSGLVNQDEKTKDGWSCSGTLGSITLADIFRSVSSTMLDTALARKKKTEISAADASRTAAQQSVDLLLMQATMAINQVVLQHLQAFDLGRLRAVASASPFRTANPSLQSYMAEPI